MNSCSNTISTPFFDIVPQGSTPAFEESIRKYLSQFNWANPPQVVQPNQRFVLYNEVEPHPQSPWGPAPFNREEETNEEYEGEIEVGPFRAKGKAKTSGKDGSVLAGVAVGGCLVLAAVALVGILFGGKE